VGGGWSKGGLGSRVLVRKEKKMSEDRGVSEGRGVSVTKGVNDVKKQRAVVEGEASANGMKLRML